MVSRLIADRSFVHAAHETARLERASSAPGGPSYELRTLRREPGQLPRGWAAQAAQDWLERVGAAVVDSRARGADLLVKAISPSGTITIRMKSPFQAGRGVEAVCEPCFVRVDVGERPETAEAWSIGRCGEGVALRAVAEGWVGACLFPAATRHRWFPMVFPTTCLGPASLDAFSRRRRRAAGTRGPLGQPRIVARAGRGRPERSLPLTRRVSSARRRAGAVALSARGIAARSKGMARRGNPLQWAHREPESERGATPVDLRDTPRRDRRRG